jgi:hypothetical protein
MVSGPARSFRNPVAVELSEALLSKRPDLADCAEAVGARVDAMTLLYADYHASVGTIDQEDVRPDAYGSF